MKRWLRYGIVGNFLTYGVGFGFMAYMGWVVWNIGQDQTTKMDEDLAKQLFTFSDSQLKQSARKAKHNFMERKQQKLMKQRMQSNQRMQKNKRASFI